MNVYVLGFFCSPTRVLLIHKTHPEWQKGFLNGVGGKVEDTETFEEAMVREFREETGWTVPAEFWQKRIRLFNYENRWTVIIFLASSTEAMIDDFQRQTSPTEEELTAVAIASLNEYSVIPNLRWIIPMILDKDLQFPVGIEDIGVN